MTNSATALHGSSTGGLPRRRRAVLERLAHLPRVRQERRRVRRREPARPPSARRRTPGTPERPGRTAPVRDRPWAARYALARTGSPSPMMTGLRPAVAVVRPLGLEPQRRGSRRSCSRSAARTSAGAGPADQNSDSCRTRPVWSGRLEVGSLPTLAEQGEAGLRRPRRPPVQPRLASAGATADDRQLGHRHGAPRSLRARGRSRRPRGREPPGARCWPPRRPGASTRQKILPADSSTQ